MTVGELRKRLETCDDGMVVSVCVETPGGYVCPDGAVVDVDRVVCGIDWHMNELLVVPRYRLRLKDDAEINKWVRRT